MTAAHSLFFILLCGVLTAYTWGMRGTIVGGERGAMLPGAALALVLLYAGGSVPLSQAYPLAATIGACAMFFGGAQTYGETVDLPTDPERASRIRGHIGVQIKGGLWFGVFGGIFADGMLAFAGRFSVLQTALLALLTMAAFAAGTFGLRLLCAKNDKLRSVLYFSRTRAESWGGLALVCVFLLLFNATLKQAFPILLGLFGFLFGALGFWCGNLARLLICKVQAKSSVSVHFVDSWKVMECIIGAFGGAGTALGWAVLYEKYVHTLTDEVIAHSGYWDPIRDKTDNILTFVYLGMFIAYLALSVTLKKRRETVEDILIWPLFCGVPLFLAATGNIFFGRVFSFGMLLFVLAEKFVLSREERYENLFGAKVLQCIWMLLTAGVFAMLLFTNYSFTAIGTMGLYTLVYLAAALYLTFDPGRLRDLRREKPSMGKALLSIGSEWTWLACGGVLAIASLMMSYRFFKI